MATYVLTEGSDIFPGDGQNTAGDDKIQGLGGNDVLRGGAGRDEVLGGSGDDLLIDDAGTDYYFGGYGYDTLSFAHWNKAIIDNIFSYSGDGDNIIETNTAYGAGIEAVELTVFDDKVVVGYDTDVIAGGGNDYIKGGRSVIGGLGDDTIELGGDRYVSTRADAGAGNDTVYRGNGKTSSIDGGEGADIVYYALSLDQYSLEKREGIVSVRHLFSGAVDTITGIEMLSFAPAQTGGQSVLVDTSTIEEGQVIVGTEGADQLLGGDGADDLNGLGGDDLLTGGASGDRFDGGEGVDTVSYALSAAAVFINRTGTYPLNDGFGDRFVSVERFELSSHDDLFRAYPIEPDPDWVAFSSGLTIAGGAGNDVVSATDFADTLFGDDGDDDLEGFKGDDEIFGGAGNDNLSGGEGRDHLQGGLGDDYLWGASNDILDGGEGVDTAWFTGYLSDYQLSLLQDGSVEILRFRGHDYAIGAVDTLIDVETLIFGSSVFDLTAWIHANAAPEGFNVLRGTAADDTVTGADGSDAIYGWSGNDTLLGGGGDDLLFGGWGVDHFDGGAGVDTVSYRNATSFVWYPRFDSDPESEASGDTFSSIERVEMTLFNDRFVWNSGSAVTLLGLQGNDSLTGGTGNDRLEGGEGNDFLGGGAGDDLLYGGAGGDAFNGGAGDDTMFSGPDGGTATGFYNGGTGYDTVDFSERTAGVVVDEREQNYISIEAFRLTAYNDRIELRASYVDESLEGQNSSDVFAGDGNDYVDGGSSSGRFYGEAGNDTIVAAWGGQGVILDGGDGDDILIAHSSGDWGDQIEGGAGNDIAMFVHDKTQYSIQRDGDAILVAHLATGFVDRLTGVEILRFGYKSDFPEDIPTAGIIDDTSQTMVLGASKADNLQGSTASDAMFGQAGSDTLSGGSGNDMISGGMANDSLYGQLGDDKLYGGDGADMLDGGAGGDKMTGGAGNDVYIVDSGNDRTYEATGGGVDLVRSSVNHTLIENVENLTLAGTASTDAVGNGLNNVLTGNSGNNVLDGRAGADTMTGGNGNDTYVVDSLGDKVVEASSTGGTDTIRSSISYALGGNFENLTLTGAASLTGTGNALANILMGNAGNNVLNGAAGNDRMYGGAGADRLFGGTGNDTLTGGAGADRFFFDTALNGSGNFDKILDFSAVDDTIFLDRSVFGAIGSSGALSAAAFHLGTSAHDASDRIIYDQASGRIFYDADGAGGAAAILFATVTAGTQLTNADFAGY